MHHCTHLHSIFYPACLVECYTYSIYRRKNRKGQISRKETPICGYFLVAKAAAPLPAWLNRPPARLEAALHWEPVWVRNRDLLGSEKPKVHSLHDCFHLSSPLCFSRLRTFAFPLILSPCCSHQTSPRRESGEFQTAKPHGPQPEPSARLLLPSKFSALSVEVLGGLVHGSYGVTSFPPRPHTQKQAAL